MKKVFTLICFLLFTIACSSTYKIKPFKDKTPDWYIVDKDEWRTLYGKALGESESLEMASRKAEALAVSNIIFKIKSELDATKKVYLTDRYKKVDGKISSTQKNDFEEKISIALENYQISKYRVSNKEVFKNNDNFKVFVEVAFKKRELFKSLDKINID